MSLDLEVDAILSLCLGKCKLNLNRNVHNVEGFKYKRFWKSRDFDSIDASIDCSIDVKA